MAPSVWDAGGVRGGRPRVQPARPSLPYGRSGSAEYPAVRGVTAGDMHPSDAPAQLTPLIGRERDLEEVATRLAGTRLVTLTGAGGVGKTRLAAAASARVAADVPDGVWWIELAAVTDPARSRPRSHGRSACGHCPACASSTRWSATCANRRALLVLDNCEHLADEVASRGVGAVARVPVADDPGDQPRAARRSAGRRAGRSRRSSPRGRGARCSSTARERVDRRWSLSDGERGGDRRDLPAARRDAARARARRGAGGRARARPTIARGLDDALGLLSARSCVADPRQQTLRASLDWSYGLLPRRRPARCCARSGVFADGTTLEFAREVCRGEGSSGRPAALETLVEHSLVRVDGSGASVRYRLLETVRQYALERLEEAGEADAVRDRHRDAFLALAEREGRDALTPRQPRGVRRARRRGGEPRGGARASARDGSRGGAARVPRARILVPRARRASARPTARSRARSTASDPPRGAAGARAGRVGVDRGQLAATSSARTQLAADAAAQAEAERGPGRDRRRAAGARQPPLLHGPDGRRGAAAALPRPGARDRGRVPARALGGAAARHRRGSSRTRTACGRGFDELRLAARAARRPRDAGVVLVRAGRGPLRARRARGRGGAARASGRRGGARSARRPPIAPPARTSR